tara:strand:+ start:487 stop:1164 length:678 start_codon:yes stop_codon:yes gene_type:complete
MPWIRDGKCVYKKNKDGSRGEKEGCSDSIEKAKDYLKALYANTDDAPKKENKSMKIKKSELLALIKEEIMKEAPFGRGMTIMPDAADNTAVPASMERGGSMDQIFESAMNHVTSDLDDQLSIISNYLATQMPDANPQKLGYTAFSILVDLGMSVPSIQDVEGYINREMDDREEDLMQEGIEGIMDPTNQQLMIDAVEKLAPLVGVMSLPVLVGLLYEKLKAMGAK